MNTEGNAMTTTNELQSEWEKSPEAWEAEKARRIQYLKDNDRRDGGSLDIFIHAAHMGMKSERLDNACVQLMRENAELRARLRDLAERPIQRAP